MSENFGHVVESSRKTISDLSLKGKERLAAQIKDEPAKTFAVVLAGSIVISLLLGYRISRIEEESKRQRFIENWMQEVTNWIGRHGQKLSAPIQAGLEATKSSVEDFSNSSARMGKQVQPFFEKQKRSFLNLF
jgi:hypothetical protein